MFSNLGIKILTGAIACSSLWKVTLAFVMASHVLRLEPPHKQHAFFTGEGFFVTCFANENRLPTRLTWQGPSGRDIITYSGRVHVEPVPHNPNYGLELVVENVKFEDKGMYTCSAAVDGTEVRTHFHLFVHQSITFIGTLEEQWGVEGNDFIVICSVRSDPPAIVTWYRNGSLLTNSDKYLLTEDGLYIRNLRRSDAGNYTCKAFVATKHSSQMKDFFIKLHVKYRPVWRKHSMKEAYSRIGHTAKLTCEAHAVPKPSFEWYRDKKLLGNDKIYKIINHVWNSTLEIFIDGSSRFGNYDCVVDNRLGVIQRSIALYEGVYPCPPTVVLYSREPGTLFVKLYHNSTDYPKIIGYRIQYRLKSEDWSTYKEAYINKTDNLLLQELNLESEYVVRAKSLNEIGYGNFSHEVSLRTKGVLAETVMDSHGLSSSSSSNAAVASRGMHHRTFSHTNFIFVIFVATAVIYDRR